MTSKALLLAGGFGTRLQPITNTTPKCLVPVGGRPILDYWVDALEQAGITSALLNTHHLPDPVRSYMADINATRAVHLSESFEPELLGSAGTVTDNRDWADDADHIVIIYADNLSDIDLGALVSFHRTHDSPITMALFHTPYPSKCGIATVDQNDAITSFVEKPDTPESNLANAGIYVVDAQAWRDFADMNAMDFGFDVLPRFVGRMHGYVHGGYHRDIGTHESLEQAEIDVKGLFG